MEHGSEELEHPIADLEISVVKHVFLFKLTVTVSGALYRSALDASGSISIPIIKGRMDEKRSNSAGFPHRELHK